MHDRELLLLLKRLERLAIVLDEFMPQCAELVRDAIAMLNEQEAVEPIIMDHIVFGTSRKCSKCNRYLFPAGRYCPNCGRMVKWE